MGNKIFVAVVTLLWGATMSWLLVAKILPPFFNGDPPSTGTLLKNQAVAWSIEVDGAPVGYAVSQAVAGALDAIEIHSRVSLTSIPLKEIAPHWMANLVQNIGDIQLEMRTRTTIELPGTNAALISRQVVEVDPEDLEAALARDAGGDHVQP